MGRSRVAYDWHGVRTTNKNATCQNLQSQMCVLVGNSRGMGVNSSVGIVVFKFCLGILAWM
jgi:hypothetical protein